MSTESLIFVNHNATMIPISDVDYIDNSPNIKLIVGSKPLSLSQLETRILHLSTATELFTHDLKPIYGFHLNLEHTIPYIILK